MTIQASTIEKVIEIKLTIPLAKVRLNNGRVVFCQRDLIPLEQRVEYWKSREADLTDGQI